MERVIQNKCSMCGDVWAELIDEVCEKCNPDSHAYYKEEEIQKESNLWDT